MKILRFVSQLIDSNSYLIINDQDNATIVIDPCDTKELLNYIDIHGYLVEYIILTHEHYDHISGVNQFREKYSSKLICSEMCNKSIQNARLNMSAYFEALLTLSGMTKKKNDIEIKPYTCKTADEHFVGYRQFEWYGQSFQLYETQGHSKGSICILIDDKCLFSGDSLLKDYEVITRLPGGSLKDYKEKTVPVLLRMNPEVITFPGHGDKFVLKEICYDQNIRLSLS